MITNPLRDQREAAILVGLEIKQASRTRLALPDASPAAGTTVEESLDELATLAESAGARVAGRCVQSRDRPEAATVLGQGKVKELAEQAEAFSADVVLFDRDLTPTQLRNLERALPCKVVDRTQLILDIFARRARTREGQLQVELAQLNYLLPRLTGRGSSMSRLGGGIGTRGPGETQLESDRRKIKGRIKKIEDQLEAVRSHRGVQRQQRQAVPLATVALVGYTNAGKSTLFNALTGAGVLADARMFATLDPTVRQIALPSRRRLLLSDTVGFIGNLPTTLVRAFRATLEEVKEAALLLHLVDAASPHAAAQTAHVLDVLHEIGASATPQILVLTKSDRWPADMPDAQDTARLLLAACGPNAPQQLPAAAVSAHTGAGLAQLLETVDQLLPVDRLRRAEFFFPHGAETDRHLLHQYGRVLEERWEESGCRMEAEASESLLRRLEPFQTKLL